MNTCTQCLHHTQRRVRPFSLHTHTAVRMSITDTTSTCTQLQGRTHVYETSSATPPPTIHSLMQSATYTCCTPVSSASFAAVRAMRQTNDFERNFANDGLRAMFVVLDSALQTAKLITRQILPRRRSFSRSCDGRPRPSTSPHSTRPQSISDASDDGSEEEVLAHAVVFFFPSWGRQPSVGIGHLSA